MRFIALIIISLYASLLKAQPVEKIRFSDRDSGLKFEKYFSWEQVKQKAAAKGFMVSPM
jgi:hypothetical protein